MYVAVAYKLMADENGETVVIEEATAEKPFQFISGFGITLDAFENQIMALEQGGTFDFTLTKDEAYGDVEPERILDLAQLRSFSSTYIPTLPSGPMP